MPVSLIMVTITLELGRAADSCWRRLRCSQRRCRKDAFFSRQTTRHLNGLLG